MTREVRYLLISSDDLETIRFNESKARFSLFEDVMLVGSEHDSSKNE